LLDEPELKQNLGRAVPQNIEAIVLQLEPLLSDILDAMPRLCPVLGCLLSEHRHAGHRDARRAQHRMVDERRALTAKAGCHHKHRLEMLCGEKVPDLIGDIEADGLDFSCWNELWLRHPRYPSHYFCNAL